MQNDRKEGTRGREQMNNSIGGKMVEW